MSGRGCGPKKTPDPAHPGISIKEARQNILRSLGMIVENRPGYTLPGVLNDVDFELLSDIMAATQTSKGPQPGRLGVNPGGQPVMSLFEFAKKS